MHVEPEKHPPSSLREFGVHYAMIVLSILTALALEQVALGIEHAHQAHAAKTEIEAEIRANQAAVASALAATRANLHDWQALRQRTVDEIRGGTSTDETRVAALREAGGQFRDAIAPLSSTAWDAAIAAHTVNYLAHEDVVRFSELYAAQRLFGQAMWEIVRDTAVRDSTDIGVAVSLGRVDPVAAVRTLTERQQVIAVLESQMAQLDAVMHQALVPGGVGAAAASH